MQLRSPGALAEAMAYSRHTVRSLAAAVGVKHARIGHLRSGFRSTCDVDLAKRIAGAVKMPLDFLFVAEPSNDTRDEVNAA